MNNVGDEDEAALRGMIRLMLAFSPLFSDGPRAYAWRALTSIAQLRFAVLCNALISFTAQRRRERARPSTKDKSRQTFDIVPSPRTETKAQKSSQYLKRAL